MKYVFVSFNVESRIEVLKKSGKTGAALTQKTMRIIEKLASGDHPHHTDPAGSYTKHGEKRIHRCRKYDLGCGYRLITLQRGETIYMPFLGTHDESHRWLQSNSRLKDLNTGAGMTIRVAKKKPMTKLSKATEKADFVSDESDLSKHLTDQDLRYVFSGLVEGLK